MKDMADYLKKIMAGFLMLWLLCLALKNSFFEFHPRYTAFDPSQIPVKIEGSLEDVNQDLVKSILNGPFKFLGKGNQSFVFESNDQQWVIKIFNFSHLKVLPLESFLFPRSYKTKKRKIERLFSAHDLAFKKNRVQAGLIYSHLKQTDDLPIILVQDRWKKTHSIDLNQAYFVIQKKGQTTREVIGNLLKQKRPEEALNHFRLLLSMYLEEYSRGLWDHDHNLMHNTGFAGGSPMRLDVGKLFYDPSIVQNYQSDLKKIIQTRISRWLKKYHPRDHDALIKELETSFLNGANCRQKNS